MASYSKQWSSATPGFLIFLVDQSWSMEDVWENSKSKAEQTALAINRVISEIISANAAGTKVKNRVSIAIIGYGDDSKANLIKKGTLSEYANSPLRQETFTKKDKEGNNINEFIPIFIEPVANGMTPMGEAFQIAKAELENWISDFPDNPAPVLINISDGAPTDRDLALNVGKEIVSLPGNDGSPLFFNVHIGDDGKKISFPVSKSELGGDSMAEFLFEISSLVPVSYMEAATKWQLPVRKDSRGFIANADGTDLIKFINFGSIGGLKDLGA